MKKSLIPILSLLFIISLDSCKKDSDSQPDEQPVGDTTRVVKLNYTYTSNSGNDYYASFYEYDKSGRIISVKDSADPSSYYTISYVGDEVIFQEVQTIPGNTVHSARYKLNSDRLPIQRVSVETVNDMNGTFPRFQSNSDTVKFEYDAAGLLVKATGAGYDTSWSKHTVQNNSQVSTQISFSANRSAYTINYTNNDGKLMAVKITGAEVDNYSGVGSSNYSNTSARNTEENFTFEYTKNYANKVDKINGWLFAELGTLYSEDIPMIKYAYLPDKSSHTRKYTDVATGSSSTLTDEPNTTELEYLPSGYISSVSYINKYGVDKYRFTYNKQ